MSEEILKALMQLFAIIAKQDGGVEDNEIDFVESFLTSQLSSDFVEEYMGLFYKHADILSREDNQQKKADGKIELTSVKDSVRILGICKKINKTLTQEQKIVVLVRVFELVAADKKFTEQRMAIINTVAEVFNISTEELKSTDTFVVNDNDQELDIQNVLIIDDNVDAAESLRDLFLLGDHRVEVAYDGATGIAKAKCFRPDLVMCDIALPGMDGYQVARAIRGVPSLTKSRLVAWTGYVRPEDIRRCAEAGFHGCMAKPLNPAQLARLLNYAANC